MKNTNTSNKVYIIQLQVIEYTSNKVYKYSLHTIKKVQPIAYNVQ